MHNWEITKDVQIVTYSCLVKCATFISRVRGMPWPKTGAAQYFGQFRLPGKGCAIKVIVISNIQDLNAFRPITKECHFSVLISVIPCPFYILSLSMTMTNIFVILSRIHFHCNHFHFSQNLCKHNIETVGTVIFLKLADETEARRVQIK